jgi:hypothetical protein
VGRVILLVHRTGCIVEEGAVVVVIKGCNELVHQGNVGVILGREVRLFDHGTDLLIVYYWADNRRWSFRANGRQWLKRY